jgi:hypothetical protein
LHRWTKKINYSSNENGTAHKLFPNDKHVSPSYNTTPLIQSLPTNLANFFHPEKSCLKIVLLAFTSIPMIFLC